MIAGATWARLDEALGARAQAHREAQQELLRAQPALRAAELDDARREALRAERTTLAELHSGGVLSGHVYSELVGEVDAALAFLGQGVPPEPDQGAMPAAGRPERLITPGDREDGR